MNTPSNNNPWEDQESQSGHPAGFQAQPAMTSQNPWQLSDQTDPSLQHHAAFSAQSDPWADTQQTGGSHAPQVQPSTQQYTAQKLPDETARFVPESERSEQREALEQFELSHHAQQSPDERNLERLTGEFPKIDSALVAAIYGDSRDLATSRELLTELSSQIQ